MCDEPAISHDQHYCSFIRFSQKHRDEVTKM